MKTKNIKFLVILGIIVLSMLVFNFSVVNASNDDEIVQFKDENLKKALLEYDTPVGSFDTNGDGELSVGELKNRWGESLMLENKGITDLTGLEYCIDNLEYLYLANNNISDISILKDFTGLNVLDLSNNKITDITPLQNIPNLLDLNLSNNNVKDISALSNLTTLYTLNLSNNCIEDFTPIDGLQIEELNIEGQRVTDNEGNGDKTDTEENVEEIETVKPEENNATKEETKGEKDNTPKTGVENNVILPTSIIAVIIAVGIIAFKK